MNTTEGVDQSCEGLLYSFLHRSAHIWFSYIHNHISCKVSALKWYGILFLPSLPIKRMSVDCRFTANFSQVTLTSHWYPIKLRGGVRHGASKLSKIKTLWLEQGSNPDLSGRSQAHSSPSHWISSIKRTHVLYLTRGYKHTQSKEDKH